jgi:hypothetical protein
MFDELALKIVTNNKNMLIPWYLMTAYAYYIEDSPLISDIIFDQLSKDLIFHWKTIEHLHKSYITLEDLEAGTFLGKYPTRIKYAVKYLKSIERKNTGPATLEAFFG